jgi:type IV pilus assembly protein PilX
MRSVKSNRNQRGAVLIISLLFLVILTMLGITAMTGSTFEERMAGNARDASVAYNAAEAALRDARAEILGIEVIPGKARTDTLSHITAFGEAPSDDLGLCVLGLCRPRKHLTDVGVILPDIPSNVTWTGTSSVTYGTYTGSPALLARTGVELQKPRYIIERFCVLLPHGSIEGAGDMCRVYRLTARGYGRNPNTQVTLQEIYYKETI